jgi:hypothetical protein
LEILQNDIIFVIAKRELLQGSRFFRPFQRASLGNYEEKLGKSYAFFGKEKFSLRAYYDFLYQKDGRIDIALKV